MCGSSPELCKNVSVKVHMYIKVFIMNKGKHILLTEYLFTHENL